MTSSEKISLDVEEEGATQCLVAIARLQPFSRQTEPKDAVPDTNDTEFVARVGLDGKFTYIDHRSVENTLCRFMYTSFAMLQLKIEAIKICRLSR